jgi:hypothetical protein
MAQQPIETWGEAFQPARIARYTRLWLHYGSIGFVVLLTLIGAVRGIAGG